MHAWLDNRIRKVARRARGAHWAAVQDLPGITVEVDGAEARALVPGLVAEAPKEVLAAADLGQRAAAGRAGPDPAPACRCSCSTRTCR